MRVAVVSAVFGGYDEPVWVQQTVDCHHVIVTDGQVNVPRQFEHVNVKSVLHPRLSAKFPKCRPWEFTDADLFVWLDGSIMPQPGLVERMIADLGDGDVAFHPHPDRRTITSEAQKSAELHKYPEWMDVRGQAQAYVESGHPDGFGLWAAGLFIWRDSMRVRQLGQLWLDEILRWSHQDQLPLPVVLRRCEVDVRPLSGGLRGNPLFKIRQHADRS